MKLFFKAKDGGSESKVTGYWLIESKKLFSIALLRFDEGSREAYHTHAFHALSWVLWGELAEHVRGEGWTWMPASVVPIITKRNRFHRVFGVGKTTWALSFRGPWQKNWKEYLPQEDKEITLASGRVIV